MNIVKDITEIMEQYCKAFQKEQEMERYLEKELTSEKVKPTVSCMDGFSNDETSWEALIKIEVTSLSKNSKEAIPIEEKINKIFKDANYVLEDNWLDPHYSVTVKLTGEI